MHGKVFVIHSEPEVYGDVVLYVHISETQTQIETNVYINKLNTDDTKGEPRLLGRQTICIKNMRKQRFGSAVQ